MNVQGWEQSNGFGAIDYRPDNFIANPMSPLISGLIGNDGGEKNQIQLTTFIAHTFFFFIACKIMANKVTGQYFSLYMLKHYSYRLK